MLRMLADLFMVFIALLLGLSIRFLTVVLKEADSSLTEFRFLFNHYIDTFLATGWVIGLMCIAAFLVSGFYTRGRSYRSRYKVLIILQAVSVGYLVSAFILYVLMGRGVQQVLNADGWEFPRSAFLISWILSCGLIAGSRLWSTIWRRIVYTEAQNQEQAARPKVQNVLVIGGAGYIGSALLKRLLDKGYNIRLLDMLLFGAEPIADMVDHPCLEVIQADFRQIDQVVEAMQDMDAVIHLGAIVGDPACALDEKLTIEINMSATRMIAEIARSNNVERFIFASTCSVYGVGEEILDEHSVLNPVSLYARSKLAAEQMLLRMETAEFSPVILRFGTIYGLSGRIRFDLVVNLLTAKAIFEGQITVFGGKQWRPFVHVDDAARAVLLALEGPLAAVRSEIFNVGSNEQNYQIDDIGKIVHQLVPEATIISKEQDTDARDYRVNFTKIHNVLHFVPKWTVEEGVRQVIQVMQDGTVKNYMDSMYSNVKFLTDEGASRLVEYSQDWMGTYLKGAVKEVQGAVKEKNG